MIIAVPWLGDFPSIWQHNRRTSIISLPGIRSHLEGGGPQPLIERQVIVEVAGQYRIGLDLG